MIFAFDLDGTLVEAWYGKTTPLFYTDAKDEALRSSDVDCYAFVHPMPFVHSFLQTASELDENCTFLILSRITNGPEYLQKLDFIKKNFINDEGKPFFSPEHIYGPTSDDDKLLILENYASSEEVVYFDDNLSFLHKLHRSQCAKAKTDNHILGVHSSSLVVKRPSEIMMAYTDYNASFL